MRTIIKTTINPIWMMRDAVLSIRGNARALLVTEPFFAIPHTMFSAFMTLYMLELGITKSQVGMITSLGLAVQLAFALVSAWLTDKFGRRYITLIFDSVSWSGALFVWAIAKDINSFILAAIINSSTRVVMNSFHCLMVEDSPPETRLHVFNYFQVAGILAGFFVCRKPRAKRGVPESF
jgi:MFS family permease